MNAVERAQECIQKGDVQGLGLVLQDALQNIDEMRAILALDKSVPEIALDLINVLEVQPSAKVISLFPRGLVAERLEIGVLNSLGIVSNMFQKKTVRANTNLYYRQTKFNLLREESEGWAKLMSEVFSALEDDTSPQGLWNNIQAMIGFFALDPLRVLDVILDIASANIISHWRFFLELLRCSTWWPSNAQISPEWEQQTSEEHRAFFDELQDTGLAVFLDTMSLNGGNYVAAQILGFKFRAYGSEPVVDSLVMLTALLIKYGFISIFHIYPHLSPADSKLVEDYETWKQSMQEKARSSKGGSALAMAAPLPSEAADEKSTKDEREPEQKVLPRTHQKLQLLKALLATGAISDAFFVLGQVEHFADPHPETADYINRIVSYSIEPIFQRDCDQSLLLDHADYQSVENKTQAPVNKSALNPFHSPGSDSKFFYDDWQSFLPICETCDDVVLVIERLLSVCGPRLCRDPRLFSKLCRIASITKGDSLRSKWSAIIRSTFLPALSLSESNPAVVQELYGLLSTFRYTERYAFYDEWISLTYSSTLELKIQFNEAERDIKRIMKRISKTNYNIQAKVLSKVANSNPCVIWSVAINQIESYDNFVEVFTEVVKDVTPMGFDTLAYVLLCKLSDEKKGRMQQNGLNVSRWLQSLAALSGELYSHYEDMNPTPLLVHVSKRLKGGYLVDLRILEEMIRRMAGIIPLNNLTSEQIEGSAGGSVLRQQVLAAIGDERKEKHASLLRLVNSMLEADLLTPFAVLIAQARQRCIFTVDEQDSQLKLLSNMFDECQATLCQFVELITMNSVEESCIEKIPDLSLLFGEFGLDPSVSFYLCRPKNRLRIQQIHQKEEEEKMDIGENVKTNGTALEAPQYTSTLTENVLEVFPSEYWQCFTPHFYATFWQLSLYDLAVPISRYSEEQKKLSDLGRTFGDRTRQRTEIEGLMNKLAAESKIQMIHYQETRARLVVESQQWFDVDSVREKGLSPRVEIIEEVLQACIYPRVLFGPEDAVFCVKFIKQLHLFGTPHFSTLTFFDRIFSSQAASMIFICTEREAENYGRFLAEILWDFSQWRINETFYKKDMLGKNMIGFRTKWDQDELLQPNQFRTVMKKWHTKLEEAITLCLESQEYMHIRNAIIVMDSICNAFPILDEHGVALMKTLEEVKDAEKREDLKIRLATIMSVLGRTKRKWVDKARFLDPSVPKRQESTKSLNPSAEKFLPLPKETPTAPASALRLNRPASDSSGAAHTPLQSRPSTPSSRSMRAKPSTRAETENKVPNASAAATPRSHREESKVSTTSSPTPRSHREEIKISATSAPTPRSHREENSEPKGGEIAKPAVPRIPADTLKNGVSGLAGATPGSAQTIRGVEKDIAVSSTSTKDGRSGLRSVAGSSTPGPAPPLGPRAQQSESSEKRKASGAAVAPGPNDDSIRTSQRGGMPPREIRESGEKRELRDSSRTSVSRPTVASSTRRRSPPPERLEYREPRPPSRVEGRGMRKSDRMDRPSDRDRWAKGDRDTLRERDLRDRERIMDRGRKHDRNSGDIIVRRDEKRRRTDRR